MSIPGRSMDLSSVSSSVFSYWTKAQEAVSQVKMEEVKSGLWNMVKNVSELALGPSAEAEAVGFVYASKQLIAMEFPSHNLSPVTGLVPIEAMAKFLKTKHAGRFMVYNLSDRTYDYKYFDEQVLEFKFPGYPSPPLDRLFSICRSIDGWLRADDSNVAAVHCQTGKGRTVVVLACYLAWVKEFPSAKEAAQHITQIKGQIPAEKMLIPTQLRYIEYFDNVTSGKYPLNRVVKIQRIIVNTVPNFVKDPADGKGGCRPYLQIFKNSKIVYSSIEDGAEISGAKWYRKEDGSILFPINLEIEGDILIRVRHLADKDNRITIFRIGAHTGYLTDGICRFEKDQIDGSQGSNRFDKEFFVDVIIDPISAVDSKDSLTPPTDSNYWETVTHRSPRPVRISPEPKVVAPFKLFEDGKTPTSDSRPSKKSNDDDSYAELENYVKGLDGVNAQNIDVESDPEEENILEQLKKELGDDILDEQSPTAKSKDKDGDDHLDDDVKAILSQFEE